jgi:hypothetical protein
MKIKVSSSTASPTAVITPQSTSHVVSVGIQGPAGPQSAVSSLADTDTTNLQNGSVLVYKTATSKWTSTTTLDLQNMEGGEF